MRPCDVRQADSSKSYEAEDDDTELFLDSKPASLREVLLSLALPLYLPMLLLFFAFAMLTPVVPLFAASLGASPRGVGVVVAARAFGAFAATLPAGEAVSRLGPRQATLVGAAVYSLSCLWGWTSSDLFTLALSRALAGAGYALYSLAQQTHVRLHCPVSLRGRVLATVGGTFRISSTLGPLAGGAIAQRVGFRAVFGVQMLASLPALPLIAAFMRPPQGTIHAAAERKPGMAELLLFVKANQKLVFVAWVATLLMAVVRSVRDLLVPLGAAAAGMSRAGTGAVLALSYASDTLVFPLGGFMMDRRGCWLAGGTACALMGLGLAVMALGGPGSLVAASVIMGIGNGFSSGIVMALGSDCAPSHCAGPVLATFNFVNAAGGVLGPLVIGAIASTSLGAGADASAMIAVAGALWWLFCLPRPQRLASAAAAQG